LRRSRPSRGRLRGASVVVGDRWSLALLVAAFVLDPSWLAHWRDAVARRPAITPYLAPVQLPGDSSPSRVSRAGDDARSSAGSPSSRAYPDHDAVTKQCALSS
jgi:hypothetical protein